MTLDFPTIGTFAVTATAIVVSPGPDTMLILRYALVYGRAAADWLPWPVCRSGCACIRRWPLRGYRP